MMWVWVAAALVTGVLGGVVLAGLLGASVTADLLEELHRLRRLEADLHRLELRVWVGDPAPTGDLFRARLSEVLPMWQWAQEDGRWSLFGPTMSLIAPPGTPGPFLHVAIDEIPPEVKL